MTSATAAPHPRTYIDSTFVMPPGYNYTPTYIADIESHEVLSRFRACIDDLAQLAIRLGTSEDVAQVVVEAYLDWHQNDLDHIFKILNDMFLLPAITSRNPLDEMLNLTVNATPAPTDIQSNTNESPAHNHSSTDTTAAPQMVSRGTQISTNDAAGPALHRSAAPWNDRLELYSRMFPSATATPLGSDAHGTASDDGNSIHPDNLVAPAGTLDDDENEPLLSWIPYGQREREYYGVPGEMGDGDGDGGRVESESDSDVLFMSDSGRALDPDRE